MSWSRLTWQSLEVHRFAFFADSAAFLRSGREAEKVWAAGQPLPSPVPMVVKSTVVQSQADVGLNPGSAFSSVSFPFMSLTLLICKVGVLICAVLL